MASEKKNKGINQGAPNFLLKAQILHTLDRLAKRQNEDIMEGLHQLF